MRAAAQSMNFQFKELGQGHMMDITAQIQLLVFQIYRNIRRKMDDDINSDRSTWYSLLQYTCVAVWYKYY